MASFLAVVLVLAGLFMIANGALTVTDTVMHQIYTAIYVTGGFLTVGIGGTVALLGDAVKVLRRDPPAVDQSRSRPASPVEATPNERKPGGRWAGKWPD